MENDVGKVNTKAEELVILSTNVLELALGIEHFLIGQTPLVTSEAQEKKQPTGWYQAHWDKLDTVRDRLNLVANSLRAVKSASE